MRRENNVVHKNVQTVALTAKIFWIMKCMSCAHLAPPWIVHLGNTKPKASTSELAMDKQPSMCEGIRMEIAHGTDQLRLYCS